MAAEVIVLGGGFAGLAAVGELARRARRGAKLNVRLIDRAPHSTFSPVLPDLISRRLSPDHICYPLAPHCRRLGVEFTQATVEAIVPDAGRVETDRGAFSADRLILCLGCENNYFGNAEMQARACGLKTIREGLAIRREVGRLAESARSASPARRRAHVVVVGGGYTGFEMASHAAYLLHRMTGRSYRALSARCGILIVDKGDVVLANCSPAVRRWALGVAGEFGIEVRTGVTVEQVEAGGAACLSDGSVLPNAVVLWAVGVAPGPVAAALDAPKVRGGRLAVDEYLRLAGRPNVFAAGDVAGAMPPGGEGPLRLAVQFSLVGGRRAAVNAVRSLQGEPLKAFAPRDPGYVIPLAPGRGAGVVLGRQVFGRAPYLLHYALCVARSWGWRNRFGMLRELMDRRWKVAQ